MQATRSRARALVALVLIAGAAACVPPAAPSDPAFQATPVLTGIQIPTAVRFASDGRVFVAERAGRILTYDSVRDTSATVVVDLTRLVTTMWDKGLMGLEVDPGFTSGRPYVYALYSLDAPPGGTAPTWLDDCLFSGLGNNGVCGVTTGQLMRIRVGADGRSTEQKVLITDWCNQFGSHSVDDLEFGPEGALYATAGEGAYFYGPDSGQYGANPCADPPGEGGMLRAQDVRTTGDPTTLDGALIRIDPDTGDAWPTNPWAGDPDPNRARIIAHGFRNPYRLAADPGSRDVFVGDVGWNEWEEVNTVTGDAPTVANFGWPCFEGPARQPLVDAEAFPICEGLGDEEVVAPLFSYWHRDSLGANCSTGGTSVTGLAVARDNGFPGAYANGLYLSDYSRECIFFVPRGEDGEYDFSKRSTFITGLGAIDLQIGPDGALYAVNIAGGTIVRIAPTGANRAPIARVAVTPQTGPLPLTVSLNASGSSDPDLYDLGALGFRWELDGDGLYDDANGPITSRTYTAAGTYTASVRVTDSKGATSTADVTVFAGNTPPTPVIDAPLEGAYAPGTLIDFSGRAGDAEQGPLPPSALEWTFTIQHCDAPGSCHAHPVATLVDTASGQFTMPDHPAPSFLDVELRATDALGATRTVTRRLTIASE